MNEQDNDKIRTPETDVVVPQGGAVA